MKTLQQGLTAWAWFVLALFMGALPGAERADATFTNVAPASGMTDATNGVGVAWADYDNDGDLDLYVGTDAQGHVLYRNDGAGSFSNVATTAGMTGSPTVLGPNWADYDNDGTLDLFISGYVGQQDILFQNQGGGVFLDVATLVGMTENPVASGRGAGWADYDADGDLDIFVGNWFGDQDFLYRNNGDGTFTNVAASVGMADSVRSHSAAWADYDNDGDLDLFVAVGEGSFQDRLYRSNGDGTFTDVAVAAGMSDGSHGFGAAWGDYDADGDLDLYVVNQVTSGAMQDFLYRNNGDGTFANVASAAGMADNSHGNGAAWGDYDNDGDLDIYVANGFRNDIQDALYRNNGDGTFTNVAASIGMAESSDGVGVAWADYDADGDLDIYVSNYNNQQDFLYRNDETGNNFIKVVALTDEDQDAVESDLEPNRLALGAKIEVDLDGGADFATGIGRYTSMLVGAGDGTGHSAIAAHLGAASASTVDVRVTFVDGDTVVLTGVSVNQTITALDPGEVPPADVTPPTISDLTASPAVLWPPNHKMVEVTVNATVQDDRDTDPTFRIVGVTCNEPADGDIVITGDHTVQLRAERDPHGTGRIYTITVEAEDDAGNTSTSTVIVTVPKSQGK